MGLNINDDVDLRRPFVLTRQIKAIIIHSLTIEASRYENQLVLPLVTEDFLLFLFPFFSIKVVN